MATLGMAKGEKMKILRLTEEIRKEIAAEKKVQRHMEKRKAKIVSGSLYVKTGSIEPYIYQSVYENGKHYYITLDQTNEEDRKVIKELMEKKTIVHGTPRLRKNIAALERCVEEIEPYSPLNYEYGDLMGKEYYLEGDVCVRDWKKKPECQNRFHPEKRIHDTKRGVKVRSKSEAMICDNLLDIEIIAKYETKLRLEGRNYYPDFEFIHPYEHKLMWWDHLGLIDDSNYVLGNLDTLDVFHRNGIVWGDNLIVTWETKDNPLTRTMIRTRFRQFGLIR